MFSYVIQAVKKGKMICMQNADDIKNVEKAINAINNLCGHCAVCSPDCYVAVARRAMEALQYDLLQLHDN